MTTVALPSTHRAQTVQIASLFYHKKMNTNQIAKIMSLPEAEIWNRMDLTRIIWRGAVAGIHERRAI
jgi:DNA-binding transcriptional regulator LsrR (DeoR family)